MTFIFRNKTIFWDISKWNRWQKKWDGGSNIQQYFVNGLSKIIYLALKILLENFYGKKKTNFLIGFSYFSQKWN